MSHRLFIPADFSSDSLQLVDGTNLYAQLQCADSFNRTTSWIVSSPVLTVTTSRSITIETPVQATNTSRGFIGSFQSSYQPLVVNFTVSPLVVYSITVRVTSTVLTVSNSTSTPLVRRCFQCKR